MHIPSFLSLHSTIRSHHAAWKELQKNTLISAMTKLTFLCIILMVGSIAYAWRLLPPVVPIWFSRPWGNEQLGSFWFLFLLPGATLFWYIVNTVFSLSVTKEHLVFSQILTIGSCAVAFLSFIATVMILWITI